MIPEVYRRRKPVYFDYTLVVSVKTAPRHPPLDLDRYQQDVAQALTNALRAIGRDDTRIKVLVQHDLKQESWISYMWVGDHPVGPQTCDTAYRVSKVVLEDHFLPG